MSVILENGLVVTEVVKLRAPYDPATALLGTYAGEKETCPTDT